MRDRKGKLLRGPSAWEAAKEARAAKNDAARADAGERREVHDAQVEASRQVARDRQERASPPR